MKKKWMFYLETFLLTISFMMVILVLSRLFVTSYEQSLYARDLNNTVFLSENLAEILRSSDDKAELKKKLEKEGNVLDGGDHFEISYDKDLKSDPEGIYLFKVYYEKENGLIEGRVEAYRNDELIYDLSLGRYLGEDER